MIKNKLKKGKQLVFYAALPSICFYYMAALCAQNKSVQLEIVSNFN